MQAGVIGLEASALAALSRPQSSDHQGPGQFITRAQA